MIDNPNFISMHLNQSKKNNANETKSFQILTFEWDELGGLSFATRCSDTFTRIAPFVEIRDDYSPCASVDGLILLSNDSQLRLWNPSIRKSVPLPKCPVSLGCSVRCAVGFAPLISDYKVVVIQCGGNGSGKPGLAVYGLRNDCWWMSVEGIDAVAGFQRMSQGLFTKGFTHWLVDCGSGIRRKNVIPMGSYAVECSFTIENRYTHVVSFDFDAEEFSFLELPDEGGMVVRSLFLIGESVALLSVYATSTSVWIVGRDAGKELWTEWYSADSCSDVYTTFLGWERIWSSEISLYVKKSDAVLINVCGELMSFNIRSHEIHHVAESVHSLDYMDTHVETLLLHKGLEAQTSASFW